jgi:hypothetical protein
MLDIQAVKKGDKVIWDSGFGYELAEYIGEGVMYYTYNIKLLTGICSGMDISHRCNEVYAYSKEKHDEMKLKYGR